MSSDISEKSLSNIDLEPSMLDVAGLPAPSYIQGKSFKPLLEGKKAPWREDFLYHYYLEVDLPKMSSAEKDAFFDQWKRLNMDPNPLLVPETLAVRTRQWKYITYPGIDEIDELYDLAKDPYEMANLDSDPGHADVVRKMKMRWARLVEETKLRVRGSGENRKKCIPRQVAPHRRFWFH